MAFKVQRREYVRYQPKWLFHFLLSLSPKVYEVKDTLEEAQANMEEIKDAIAEYDFHGYLTRLHIKKDGDVITIDSKKGRKYLKFYIQDNYKKI